MSLKATIEVGGRLDALTVGENAETQRIPVFERIAMLERAADALRLNSKMEPKRNRDPSYGEPTA